MQEAGSRNIWKRTRDRERQQARFQVRERIAALSFHVGPDHPAPPTPTSGESATKRAITGHEQQQYRNGKINDRFKGKDSIAGRKSELHAASLNLAPSAVVAATVNDSLLRAVEKGQPSQFGLAKLANLPHEALDELHNPLRLDRGRIVELCTSRFSAAFAERVLLYLDSFLPKKSADSTTHNSRCGCGGGGISLVAYAALLGEYQIVACLLRAGADPTRRWEPPPVEPRKPDFPAPCRGDPEGKTTDVQIKAVQSCGSTKCRLTADGAEGFMVPSTEDKGAGSGVDRELLTKKAFPAVHQTPFHAHPVVETESIPGHERGGALVDGENYVACFSPEKMEQLYSPSGNNDVFAFDPGWISGRSSFLAARILKRFFSVFPQTFAVWIVRCVVVMRMEGVCAEAQQMNAHVFASSAGDGGPTSQNSAESMDQRNLGNKGSDGFRRMTRHCSICCGDQSYPSVNWGEPCYHSFCEDCLWTDVLKFIEDRDELMCPICQARRAPLATDNAKGKEWGAKFTQNKLSTQKSLGTDSSQRNSMSLQKFQALPMTVSELKHLRRKKIGKNRVDFCWSNAVRHSLGRSQDVRREKFFLFVSQNAPHYVRACLEAGVDVDDTNEYHQTNLYIAAWLGYASVTKLLLQYGADPFILPNGQCSSALSVAMEHTHDEVVGLLQQCIERKEGATTSAMPRNTLTHMHCSSQQRVMGGSPGNGKSHVTILIPKSAEHPGAGALLVDHALSAHQLEKLEALWRTLPVTAGKCGELKTSCSVRSYFCDAGGILCDVIAKSIPIEALCNSNSGQRALVMPYMRFLHYQHPSSYLPPHVDLCRTGHSGERSSHTFILYLYDCEQGGATSLLRDAADPGNKEKLASVQPKRGRLLLFPHLCPHEGSPVITVPKVLIRGEVCLVNDKDIC